MGTYLAELSYDNTIVSSCFTVTASADFEVEAVEAFREGLASDLLAVVDSFPQLFAPPDREPPERTVKHAIRLIPDAYPLKRKPFPLPPYKIKEMHTQITELHQKSWIEPSHSPWGTPILFVPKKPNALRLCIDFRDLNAVTVDDSYPLPRIDVLLHRAAQARYFSKLDLASSFHQIEVEPESRPLTAFRLPEPIGENSLWQWKVMPFGLRNAPPTFQRAMTVALEGTEDFASAYMDDVLIFSRTYEEYLQHLRTIFQSFSAHSYHLRLPKCEFIQEEVEFLGHRITKRGVEIMFDKIAAVQKWSFPLTTSRQVKAFLGLVM